MTNKSLILGVVALCALPAAGQAQVLINENFDAIPTVMGFPSGPVGPFFTGAHVNIAGNFPTANAPGQCRGPSSGNCALLNGMTGVLTSKPVTLEPGVSYFLSFDALARTNLGPNTVTVSLGPVGSRSFLFDDPITMPLNDTTTGVVTDHLIRVTMPETVQLIFRASGGNGGPVLDNIRLAAAAVPEPATLGLMVLGLLGGAGFAGRRRRS